MPPLAPERDGPQRDGLRNAVLVIDDNVEIQELLAVAVARAGALPVPVASTAVAAALNEHRPFAVITDVMMPERDGLEVLADIAGFDPAISVLLVSGYGPFYLGIAARLAGPLRAQHVETLMKPVRIRDILAFLARARVQAGLAAPGALPAGTLPPRQAGE